MPAESTSLLMPTMSSMNSLLPQPARLLRSLLCFSKTRKRIPSRTLKDISAGPTNTGHVAAGRKESSDYQNCLIEVSIPAQKGASLPSPTQPGLPPSGSTPCTPIQEPDSSGQADSLNSTVIVCSEHHPRSQQLVVLLLVLVSAFLSHSRKQ